MGIYNSGYKEGNYITHTRGLITPFITAHEPPSSRVLHDFADAAAKRIFDLGNFSYRRKQLHKLNQLHLNNFMPGLSSGTWIQVQHVSRASNVKHSYILLTEAPVLFVNLDDVLETRRRWIYYRGLNN